MWSPELFLFHGQEQSKFMLKSMKKIITRMHSSRMRTGRTLTVFRCLVPEGGGRVYPQRKQKSKKNSPPKKIGGSPLSPPATPLNHTPLNHTPLSTTPLKNWRKPPEKLETPQKIGDPPGLTCKACWDTHPPGTDLQGHPPTTPSPVDRQTLVKILPWPKLRFGR